MLPNVMGPPGLREQKKWKARNALERAALKLFEERGFDAATIKEIAEAAGMSPRTFFRYFSSKEDVVFSRVTEEFEVLKGLLASEPIGDCSLSTLKRVLRAFAEHFQSQPPEDIQLRAKLLAESSALRRRAAYEIQAWGDVLAIDLAAREGQPPEPRHNLLTGVTLQAMQVAGAAWGRDPSKPYPEILDEMFEELEAAVSQARPLEAGS
jgi:AcrR family transcriptional regulator